MGMVSCDLSVQCCLEPVHTDASDKQLGAVISQKNKIITFLSRRLIKPQHNYNTTDKELEESVYYMQPHQNGVCMLGKKISHDHIDVFYFCAWLHATNISPCMAVCESSADYADVCGRVKHSSHVGLSFLCSFFTFLGEGFGLSS